MNRAFTFNFVALFFFMTYHKIDKADLQEPSAFTLVALVEAQNLLTIILIFATK